MKNKYWKFIIFLFIFHHLFFLSPQSVHAQQHWLWAQSGGGKGADQVSSIAVDSAGDVFVLGSYADSAVFSSVHIGVIKGNHFFLAEYSKDGLLLWIKTSGLTAGQSQGTGIALSKDNYLYITGYFSDSLSIGSTVLKSSGTDDIFLAKYDLEGTAQWAVRGGGSGYNLARGISVNAVSGNISITGSFAGTAHFGDKEITSNGGDDIFLVTYDPSGTVQWAKKFGSRFDDAGFGITAGSFGNIAITGTFSDTADFGGKKLIAKGKSDIFIAKYSPDGNLLWAEQAGDTAYGQGAGIVMDSKENVYVTGRFYFDAPGSVPACDGIGNIYIAKYNSTGIKQWMKCAGNGGEESGDGIALDSSGFIYITGGYDFRINFGSGQIPNYGIIDAFVVKFNSAGIAQWAEPAGGKGDDFGTSIALDRTGNVLLGGAFSDTSAFGSITMVSQHLTDAFIGKIGVEASVNEVTALNSHISIYPNPSRSGITIVFANDEKDSEVKIEINNLLGVCCKKNIFRNESASTVNIMDLPKGIYFCRASTTSWSESRMIVLE